MDQERVVADLAAGQWGLLTTAQVARRGVSRLQLSRLAAAGLLDRYAHGVYRMRGAGDDVHAELRAAWLSLDPSHSAEERLREPLAGPVVSHASAAAVQGLGDIIADRHELTVPSRRQTQRSSIRLHCRQLASTDLTIVDGLPVTTPTRTVVDLLADRHDTDHVATVLADAVRAGTADLDALPDLIAPYAARHGHRAGDGQALLEALLERGGLDEATLRAQILASPAGQQVADAVARASMAATLRAVSEQISPRLPAEMLDQLKAAGLRPSPVLATLAANSRLRATLDQIAADAGLQPGISRALLQLSPMLASISKSAQMQRRLFDNAAQADAPAIAPRGDNDGDLDELGLDR